VGFKDAADARAKARLGGLAKAAKRRQHTAPPPPFAGTILDVMDAARLTGPSWEAWRTFWRVVFGLPLSQADRATFMGHTGRLCVPAGPLREVWLIVGRRGGKSRAGAALYALWSAVRRDYAPLLAPGEKCVVPVVAADRKQARQVLSYLKGMARLPVFAPYVVAMLKDSVAFTTNAIVDVHSASWRSTRGYTSPAVVADEIAFWSNEDSANPDAEILAALRPGMATIPGAMLLGCSTPYAQRGELFKAFRRAYGQETDDVLVWKATSAEMNPSLDAATIAQAYEDDPAAAASEWGGDFRSDVSGFLDPEAVRACIVPDRRELPAVPGVRYVAFVDPSGGSVDSFTLCIAHREETKVPRPITMADADRIAAQRRSGQTNTRAVLDVLRERRPPFSPEDVVGEFAALLKSYGLSEVTGDHYAGQWPREAFAKAGIRYVTADQPKSAYYLELLPLVSAGRVELLDLPRLSAQLVGLERRTARSGKDSVDHAPGAHDDLANVAAGAAVLAAGPHQAPMLVSFGMSI
jgi:hypothetical protein